MSAQMRVGGVMIWLEFVPIWLDVRRTQARPKFIGGSEKSVAQIDAVGCKEHRNDETGPAKRGDHPEHIDVRLGFWRVGRNSRLGHRAWAWRNTRSGSHCHLRLLTRACAVAGAPAMAAPRYGSISGKDNRVTVVTCRAAAGSAQETWQVRYCPAASAALRKFVPPPLHRH